MPQDLTIQRIHCPHCGHHSRISVDSSLGDQDYYEECPACCNEIHVNLHINEYQKKIYFKNELLN